MVLLARVVVLSLGCLAVAACTLASPTYVSARQGSPLEEDGGTGLTAQSSTASPTSGGMCGTDDFDTPDVAKLKACGNGKGHCFAKDKTPLADGFEACPTAGEVCVPDEIVKSGGKKLQSCKSIIGPGGCLTIDLVPEMKKRGGNILTQDSCPASQICAPCTNPEANNAPTGLCEPIGLHKNACTGGGAKKEEVGCCKDAKSGKSNGVCLPSSSIPPDMLDDTIEDTCTDDNKCVPASLVHEPVKCSSRFFGGGVCIDNCFNGLLAIVSEIGILDRDICGETETCIPCALSPAITPGCGGK